MATRTNTKENNLNNNKQTIEYKNTHGKYVFPSLLSVSFKWQSYIGGLWIILSTELGVLSWQFKFISQLEKIIKLYKKKKS